MSAWRRVAIENLPRLRDMIEHAESVGTLWPELWCEFEKAHREPLDEPTIIGVYAFAWWTLACEDSDIASSTICSFFEELPTQPLVRQRLPHYMTRKQFRGVINLFKYNLSEEEHRVFVDGFLGDSAKY